MNVFGEDTNIYEGLPNFHSTLMCDFSGLGQLGQGSVSMGGFGQSLGQLNQTSGLSPALPISTGNTVYQAHYGLNSL
ncbi:hypothetical protein HHI36_002326, partial [Cryptolaemus montrouzieri]